MTAVSNFRSNREFFGYEGPDPNILEADGVQHPGGGRVEPRGGGAFDGLTRKALGDEASEAVQVYEVGEFEAVTEGSTGGENRIPQAQRANLDTQINGLGGTHFGEKNITVRGLIAQELHNFRVVRVGCD